MTTVFESEVFDPAAFDITGGSQQGSRTSFVERAVRKPFEWLGRGIAHPFRWDGRGDFVSVAGVEKVEQCVAQILGTPRGKLPWRMSFGASLTRFRHVNNSRELSIEARMEIEEALRKWEPRVRLRGVSVSKAAENQLVVYINYEIGGQLYDKQMTV